MAMKIGNDLRNNGNDVHFVIHRASSVLFEGSNLGFDVVDDCLGGLIRLYVEQLVQARKPHSIILCDFFSNTNYLLRRGVHPSFLWDYSIPVVALDTWDYTTTGSTVDLGCGRSEELSLRSSPDVIDLFGRIHVRLVPAPVSPCRYNSTVFDCLPEIASVSHHQRTMMRDKIGAYGTQRLILFCTAKWQQASYRDPDAGRLAEMLPRLLSHYVSIFGSDVKLIHVGPSRLEAFSELEGRYHWIGQMASNKLDLLISSVDLVLSANISGTVLSKAFLVGTPTLVIQNSVYATTVDEFMQQTNCISPDIEYLLTPCFPLFPFRLWPLGYYQFLEPLLKDNPICDACQIVELLDQAQFTRVCSDLLFDVNSRLVQIESQLDYVRKVRKLPSSADLIAAIMS